jgi:acyl carrier protein
MMDGTVMDRLREILGDVLSVAPEHITPEATVMEALGAESIDLLDLRFRLEKAFGLRITNQDLARAFGPEITPTEFRRVFTVGAMCAYLEGRLAGTDG